MTEAVPVIRSVGASPMYVDTRINRTTKLNEQKGVGA